TAPSGVDVVDPPRSSLGPQHARCPARDAEVPMNHRLALVVCLVLPSAACTAPRDPTKEARTPAIGCIDGDGVPMPCKGDAGDAGVSDGARDGAIGDTSTSTDADDAGPDDVGDAGPLDGDIQDVDGSASDGSDASASDGADAGSDGDGSTGDASDAGDDDAD